MHRFRKKSDAKRAQLPTTTTTSANGREIDIPSSLPELPVANDFRTSLILPDLSRRFSLLRSSSGDPVSIELLRSRLAGQRARGAENQISEEEEDMLLETLGRLRSSTRNSPSPAPHASQEQVGDGADDGLRNSIRSTTASTSSVTSSPSGRSTKRYSNNLFGSARLRDYAYLKSVSSSKGSTASTRTHSLTPTEGSIATKQDSNASLRPVTPVSPESSELSSSAQSSPNDRGTIRSPPLVSPDPFINESAAQVLTAAEQQLQNTLGPASFKRASMALQQAIKEIEDEVEDEILLPRSTPIARGNAESHSPEVRDSYASNHSSLYEPGMAISIDQTIHDEFSERRQSPVPARVIPGNGYVPGMPRPMTPRDFEFDEVRSHSTTPRAQSPYDSPGSTSMGSISSSTNKIMRRESLSSTNRPVTPVSAAPLFLQRSTNGRHTPTADDSARSGGGDSADFDSPLGSSVLGRRRPASPLSGPSFQPMAVTNRPPSRPTTPSNITWTTSATSGNGRDGHSRNNSWTSSAEAGVSSNDSRPGSRTLRSPPLPDSPTLDFGQSAPFSFAQAGNPSTPNGHQMSFSQQPHAYIPEVDFGSPMSASFVSNGQQRSDTPTQTGQRSPTSPTFSSFDISPRNGGGSARSSRQNPPSSPFNVSSFSPLGFAPRANSSRSSLDSAGSSFHSWDESDKVLSVFSDSKDQTLAWHDFGDVERTRSTTPSGGSPDDGEWDPEEIIQRYAGLKKADIAAVQEKLVAAAYVRLASNERAPSALRRRRPSTSQSVRIASPPPQTQPPASPSPYATEDQLSKASALLNSVVESINEHPPAPGPQAIIATSSQDTEVSINTRRNRDLAHVLFGTEDETGEEPQEEETKPEPEPEYKPVFSKPAATPTTATIANTQPTTTTISTPPATSPPESSSNAEPTSSQSFSSPYLLLRNPSRSKIPPTPKEQAELAREVQEKTAAAMIALNKDPSRTNLGDGLKHIPSIRRRVDPSQISTPKLVSTTTSVETIPLRSPSLSSNNNSGPSKLGSRFKRLRGSLRAKTVTSSGEETEVPPEAAKSPPASQTVHYDPEKLNPPGAPKLSSATETGRFKVPLASPPASAGPGLKGFMARFRNKQRMSEMPAPGERSNLSVPRATSPLSPTSPLTPRQAEPITPRAATSPTDRSHNLTPRPAGQPRPMYSRFPPADASVLASAPPTPASAPVTARPQTPAEQLDASQSAAALEQLFTAGKNLGLDEGALNELLARSGSISSRTLLSRNTSTTTAPTTRSATLNAQQLTQVGSTGSDQTATPATYNEERLKASTPDIRPATPDDTITRKPSTRKAEHLRKPKEGQTENAANTIVRRTVFYANDVSAADFSALLQRKNSARRKRASGTSFSNRSVQDRAPTPPPPKSPSGKRFSADGLPPMPQMPHLQGQADKMLLGVPPSSSSGPIEKSNSTYDSLYDMYSGESRAASVVPYDPNSPPESQNPKGESSPGLEQGPALELIELANGETIWNIVNGLRDGDDESIYSGRASFTSEYSTREDGQSVFTKEHGRSTSKGSASSFVSKKKPQQGKVRPETKVFYSSSAQIGRLIESLSQGADAGSFNFLPNLPSRGPGHSASSSMSTNDINWTVEERLDRMLGAMNMHNT
ncbi:hypothetical protein CPC08DRAFT_116394 [Agrocybe pediades]|nr:hypothetical protein CPC08DRAFT_116394 [Agrocybe pediades]